MEFQLCVQLILLSVGSRSNHYHFRLGRRNNRLFSRGSQRDREQLRLSNSNMSQWTDLLGLIVNIRSHLAKNHFMTKLRVGKTLSLLSHNLPHHTPDRMLLRTLHAAMTERDNIDTHQILVWRLTREYSIDTSTSTSHETSQVVERIFMTLENCLRTVSRCRRYQKMELG